MATERKPYTFNRFGGLRLDLTPDEVGAEQAAALLDVDWDVGIGGIRPRMGADKLNAAEYASRVGAIFAHSSTNLLGFERAAVPVLRAYNEAGASIAELAAGGSSSVRLAFARFGTASAAYTYIALSIGMRRFDGTTLTTPSITVDGVAGKLLPTSVGGIVTWPDAGNRLVLLGPSSGAPIAFGIGSTRSHVWFSDAGNAESWHVTAPEANYAQLAPNDGEVITGGCVYGGKLFVFKQTKLFIFYAPTATNAEGAPTFPFREVPLGTKIRDTWNLGGELGHHSNVICCPTPYGVAFVSEDGVFLTTGAEPTCISPQLAPLANESSRTIFGPAKGLYTNFRESMGVNFMAGRLYVKVGTETLLVYDFERQAWLAWNEKCNTLAVWDGGKNNAENFPRLFFSGYFSAEKRFIYRFRAGLTEDQATAMKPFWQSGLYDLGSADEKDVVESKVFGLGEVELSAFHDFSKTADFKTLLELPADPGGEGREYSAQPSAVYLAHRLDFPAGVGENQAAVQRITRYLREERVATTQT